MTNQKWTIQRNWQYRVHKTKTNKTKTQHMRWTPLCANKYKRRKQDTSPPTNKYKRRKQDTSPPTNKYKRRKQDTSPPTNNWRQRQTEHRLHAEIVYILNVKHAVISILNQLCSFGIKIIINCCSTICSK